MLAANRTMHGDSWGRVSQAQPSDDECRGQGLYGGPGCIHARDVAILHACGPDGRLDIEMHPVAGRTQARIVNASGFSLGLDLLVGTRGLAIPRTCWCQAEQGPGKAC